MTFLNNPAEGGCSCGKLRYRLTSEPLIIHCCHCRKCQCQTGSAFVINALMEANCVEIISGQVEQVSVETPSGKGQNIARCKKCKVAVWSNYYMGGINELIRFVRVGTLDEPDNFPPDVHIFTTTKQPWVNLPKDSHVVDIFYDYHTTWSPENLKKRKTLLKAAGVIA